MRQVIIRAGEAVVEQTPAPTVKPGTVLVRTTASCISVGTELSGLSAQQEPLWKRALRNPDKVLRALRMAAEQGIGATARTVKGTQAAGLAVGYSATGKIVEIGEGVSGFSIGQRVACAGAGHAMHAEVICVPKNLTVPVPDEVSDKAAATVTLGAIALQGVRRLAPTMGETFVVLGMGILGQIAAQLLKANGCRVIAMDLDEARVQRAETAGADIGITSARTVPVDAISRLTGGHGADGVMVTAAADDPQLLNSAFAMCRRKGRVVLVGDVPIRIDREAIYRNELEFLISTSYGPGRYDPAFEEEGLDYPIGYVRWTETRNMAAYLDLLAAGRLDIEPMLDAEYPIEAAPQAYGALTAPGKDRPLSLILAYPATDKALARKVRLRDHVVPAKGKVNVALVGASGFARAVHLPNLMDQKDRLRLAAVQSSTGHAARELASAHGADYATTDLDEILADDTIDMVLIAGRHHLHARQALAALRAGKHVFVEKPLALDESELAPIEAFYKEDGTDKPLLMTGFNRRFAPAIQILRKQLARRNGPAVITYRMNAGHIPHSHWVQGPQGGGRNIGEACHIYDLFTALTDAHPVNIAASAIGREDAHDTRNENFSVSLTFSDGSLATLIYTSLGHPDVPKERMEVFFDGKVLTLDDYRQLTAAGRNAPLWKGAQDKGHRAEMAVLAQALCEGGAWPIPLWHQMQASRIAFEVERLIHQQSPTQEAP